MTGKLVDLKIQSWPKRAQLLTVNILDVDFADTYDALKDWLVTITIKKRNCHRTISQNNYYWSLLGQIATASRISKAYAHNIMLRRYGQLAQFGDQVVFVVLLDTDAAAYRADESETFHVKPTSEVIAGADGRMYRTYLLLRGSSTYDTAEMNCLIDGATSEAQRLGISTYTPDELDRLRSLWAQAEGMGK